ncbi:hypothetical protein niasHT_020792 [Heterodera trifolii]|uniref:guanylate cyclase n=1 Tax=Heterodera trifolii TaxID=157864 RepID=A0ABD2KF49_9BILA
MRPLQVVNLMNELYTIFDAIIDEHDVYKVESIGDGYLCVSGLPNRNGTLHAKHCADMAIKFIQALLNFRILDHPNERVRLRVGLHSGPCVAGVQISLRNGSLSMWSSRGGSIPPPAVPICGFDGNGCTASVFEMYKGYFLLGIALFVVTISGSTFTVGFLIHAKFVEGRRSNMSWKIPFALLTKSKPKRAERTAASRSRHSIRSNQTNISSPTHSTIGSLARSRIFSLYSYNGEKCIVRSFGSTTMAKALTVAQMTECRTMRLFGHENVNRFLGLSLDGPNVLAVWNFCLRGSIRDVILSENAMVKDVMFIQSAIKEICEGIHFLHNSPLQFHGGLKSSACLINDRWQVKISYFGLRWLKSSQKNGAKGK